MAAVENLEIIVDIQIADAIEDLKDLQRELRDVARSISRVDARGAEGIDINTRVDDISDDLAATRAKIEAFEATTSVDIPMDVHDRGFQEILGRAGAQSVFDLRTRGSGRILESIGDITPDLSGFGRARRMRGAGIQNRFRRLSRLIRNTLDNLYEFDLRMSDMHNAMARLIPLLIVFIGVIPTAVAALLTLATAAITAAGALVAVGGFGALGAAAGRGERPSMEDLQELFSEVVDDAWEAFAPLAERLGPVFMDALDGLEMFFNAIAQQGDALTTLVDDLEAFGSFVMDFIPAMLRTMSATLEALAPLFGGMADFLEDSQIMRDLVEVTMEAAPALADLTIRLGNAMMILAEMGVGFTVVTTKIAAFIGAIHNAFLMLGFTNEQLGLLIGTLLTFITTITIVNTKLVTMAGKALLSATIAIYEFWAGLIAADSAMAFMAATTIGNAIGSLASFVTSVLTGSVSLQILTGSALTATGALAALMTVLTIGGGLALVAMAMSAAQSFFSMASGINEATNALQEFDRVAGRTEGTDFNPYGGQSPAGTRSGGTGAVGSSGGGVTINYESQNDTGDDTSNLDKTAWRANRTT